MRQPIHGVQSPGAAWIFVSSFQTEKIICSVVEIKNIADCNQETRGDCEEIELMNWPLSWRAMMKYALWTSRGSQERLRGHWPFLCPQALSGNNFPRYSSIFRVLHNGIDVIEKLGVKGLVSGATLQEPHRVWIKKCTYAMRLDIAFFVCAGMVGMFEETAARPYETWALLKCVIR